MLDPITTERRVPPMGRHAGIYGTTQAIGRITLCYLKPVIWQIVSHHIIYLRFGRLAVVRIADVEIGWWLAYVPANSSTSSRQLPAAVSQLPLMMKKYVKSIHGDTAPASLVGCSFLVHNGTLGGL